MSKPIPTCVLCEARIPENQDRQELVSAFSLVKVSLSPRLRMAWHKGPRDWPRFKSGHPGRSTRLAKSPFPAPREAIPGPATQPVPTTLPEPLPPTGARAAIPFAPKLQKRVRPRDAAAGPGQRQPSFCQGQTPRSPREKLRLFLALPGSSHPLQQSRLLKTRSLP